MVLLVMKLGIPDKQRQASSRLKVKLPETQKQAEDVLILPIATLLCPMGILSESSIDAQMSLVDPSRLGEVRAWATERRATNDTKKRILVMRVGQEEKHKQAKTTLSRF
jgi:hypothetical protein